MPNADITFLTGLKEYELNLEVVYVTSGRAGGLYFGGGLAFRNSIYGDDASSPRETRQGYSAVVGLKAATGELFGSQVEFRWIFLPDADFDPRQITLGINFSLWGGSERRGSTGFGP
jgi:hypothetical protein